jgi:hypothetical protein
MSDDVNYRELMVAKALTKEELNQEAVWAEQFERWWDAEGQYHRAGGNDYCKTFAWWAWLNREKSKQAEIDWLKAQLNNMEQCYIQAKKERDELNQWNNNQYELIKRNESQTQSLRHLLQKLIDDSYTTMRPSMAYEIQEALRGEHE